MAEKKTPPAARAKPLPKRKRGPKAKRTDRPGGKPPGDAGEEVVVSRQIMRRHSGRGGRGR